MIHEDAHAAESDYIRDHEFQPVAGHPDDDECTHRADGTDATYCGRPKANHVDGDPLIGPDGFTRLAATIAADAALVRVAQAEALRAAARRFVEEMADAWGGDSQWLTTGTRVAEVVACVLREMAVEFDQPDACEHAWEPYREGGGGYSETDQCRRCGAYRSGWSCSHEWLDRPESDTRVCELCGEER